MRPSRGHQSRRATAAGLACLLAGLALTLTACTEKATPQPPTGPGPGLPVVGQCRVLTVADIEPASNATPTVPCSEPHTSRTISVGVFPAAKITNESLTSGSLGNQALRRCTKAWRHTVGGGAKNQHLAILDLAYYLPSQQQLAKGARWYRCDVVAGGHDGLALQDLPDEVDGILSGVVPDNLRACRTGTDFNSGREVTCDQDHVLRAIGVTRLAGDSTYPGKTALRAASAKGCRQVIKTWLHGRIDGGDAYQWPDKTGWEIQGDHYATCWTVTTN